ncbi:MAG: hypothetical protein KDC98_07925 [Planctomycetes bacterium]|nr:hypothetical protein [Planctomycetota bacterium]
MSPNAPDQASATFANNIGANAVTVLPRTVVQFPGTARPGLDPAPAFELLIPYATPFTVPAQGGTVCIDVTVFGNSTPSGNNRNFSVYLDGHQNYANGDAEQPGFRFGSGCPARGNTLATYGALTLWHVGSGMELEASVRNGIADDGSGMTRAWVALGTQPVSMPWPLQPSCTVFGSNDVWFEMPGAMTTQGRYDGTLTGLPVLPPGFRLWCQTGSAHLGSGEVSFGDGVTLVTQPSGPMPIPVSRIANSNDHTAVSGSVSYSVPVISLF